MSVNITCHSFQMDDEYFFNNMLQLFPIYKDELWIRCCACSPEMNGRGGAQRSWPLTPCTSKTFWNSFTQTISTANSTRWSLLFSCDRKRELNPPFFLFIYLNLTSCRNKSLVQSCSKEECSDSRVIITEYIKITGIFFLIKNAYLNNRTTWI